MEKNKFNEWTLRYGFLETLQIVIDISCHLVSKYNLGNPKNYNECIELLEKFNYIAKELKKKLIGMVGLRNILVHEYISIDLEKLYSLLKDLDDIKKFVSEIKTYI